MKRSRILIFGIRYTLCIVQEVVKHTYRNAGLLLMEVNLENKKQNGVEVYHYFAQNKLISKDEKKR